jgi:two-component system, NtrC family, sensor kinase
MRIRWFQGILGWVVIAGIVLVSLAILLNHALDRQLIEQTGAKNLHAEFLRAAGTVSRIISKSGDIRNVSAIEEAFQDIFELRPGIRRLSVFELLPDSSKRIYTSDSTFAPPMLSKYERNEIAAGRSVTHFYKEGSDRGWIVAAPIFVREEVVGALRGQFSLWKYDELIRQEGQSAKDIAIGAVIISSLAFLLLVRIKVDRPISLLLRTMRRAEAGDLTGHAPLMGPADIQEVVYQFNQMLDRFREALVAKEQLLGEVQGFNDTLVKTVAETREELDRANLLLVEARIRTERASKLAELGELSTVVAHELGNPLNAMSGHLQLFQKKMSSQEPDRHLAIIRAEIDRMTSIIQHILASTRTEIQSEPVDLNSVIEDVQRLIVPSLSRDDIVLKTDLAPSLPLVAGDRRALHGVIFNLVTNAMQAMPDGGELEIVTSPSIEGSVGSSVFFRGATLKDGAVRLTVRDSGCGIAPEHLPRIFEPFFTTRHHEGGTGLGLAMCQRVISSLGGRIGVESVIGHGTRFIVDLLPWEGARKVGGASDGG